MQRDMEALRASLSAQKNETAEWKNKYMAISEKAQKIELEMKDLKTGSVERQSEECKVLEKRVTEVTLRLTERERLLERYRGEDRQRGSSRNAQSHSKEKEEAVRLRRYYEQEGHPQSILRTLDSRPHSCPLSSGRSLS